MKKGAQEGEDGAALMTYVNKVVTENFSTNRRLRRRTSKPTMLLRLL
jgi:hypothetical protein